MRVRLIRLPYVTYHVICHQAVHLLFVVEGCSSALDDLLPD